MQSDDVELDLSNHLVSNDREAGYTLLSHFNYTPSGSTYRNIRRTSIRNGTLRSPYADGIGVWLAKNSGLFLAEVLAPYRLGGRVQLVEPESETAHLLENLTIDATKLAILIDGRNNIIRNCRIIVDSSTAFVSRGAGLIFENNVIEVRDTLEARYRIAALWGRSDPPVIDLPIHLIQADGAIVRNNRIEFAGSTARKARKSIPAAIELVESSDVLVEGNETRGMDAFVRDDSKSSHHGKRNEVR